MNYIEMNFVEELIMAKIKGSLIKKNMLLHLLLKGDFYYQTKDYEFAINRLIQNGKLKEKDGFIRHKDSEDLTQLFIEHNGVLVIWASKI